MSYLADDPKNNPNKIGMDGTQKYCGDIGVSVEDVSFFILSEIVQSTAMGEIEREGFVDGWGQLKYVLHVPFYNPLNPFREDTSHQES